MAIVIAPNFIVFLDGGIQSEFIQTFFVQRGIKNPEFFKHL